MYGAVVRAVSALASTPRWPAFMAALSRYAGVAFKSVGDVINWAKNNKAATLMIGSSLSEVGMSVADFFKGEEKTEEVKLAAQEMTEYRKASPALIKHLVGILNNDGDKLAVDNNSDAAVDTKLARVTLAFVKSKLLYSAATVDEVLEMHAALQLFAAMSRDSVAELMRDQVTRVPSYDPRYMREVLLAGV